MMSKTTPVAVSFTTMGWARLKIKASPSEPFGTVGEPERDADRSVRREV